MGILTIAIESSQIEYRSPRGNRLSQIILLLLIVNQLK